MADISQGMADGDDMTLDGLRFKYHMVFAEYGFMVLAHHDRRHRARNAAKLVAYAAKIVYLHRGLEARLAIVVSDDIRHDLQIMHDRVAALMEIIKDHFRADLAMMREFG